MVRNLVLLVAQEVAEHVLQRGLRIVDGGPVHEVGPLAEQNLVNDCLAFKVAPKRRGEGEMQSHHPSVHQS